MPRPQRAGYARQVAERAISIELDTATCTVLTRSFCELLVGQREFLIGNLQIGGALGDLDLKTRVERLELTVLL